MKRVICALVGGIIGIAALSAGATVLQWIKDDDVNWTRNAYDYFPKPTTANVSSYLNTGKAIARIEVINKPSNRTADIQLCLWQNGYSLETCASCQRMPVGPITNGSPNGVMYINWGAPAGWWKKAGDLDWTRTADYYYCMIKDGDCGCGNELMMDGSCGAACWPHGATELSKHVPIKYKIEVYLLASTDKLICPPTWTDAPSSICTPSTGVIKNSIAAKVRDIKIILNNGKINVHVPRQLASGRLTVFDQKGSRLFGMDINDISSGSGDAIVETPEKLGPGVYIVQLAAGREVYAGRLVLSK